MAEPGARDISLFDALGDAGRRRELFRRLHQGSDGVRALVDLRTRLLTQLSDHPEFSAVDADLLAPLRIAFQRHFLEFRRIDARTPPAILRRLMKYEAVHRIDGWRDLMRRLADDRRCYAFFHPAMPDEPLIFIEAALTAEMSTRVAPLIDPAAPIADPASCRAAMFYSISNCHEGLRGIPFGNLLIREVVADIGRTLPDVRMFATLSPVSGFRRWLESAHSSLLFEVLRLDGWNADEEIADALGRELVPLCAYYLQRVKQGRAPADPVARFHLGNGARLERINWRGDTSAAGLERSAGLMANYVYDLAETDANHDAFRSAGRVAASAHVERLAHEAQARYY